MSQETILLVDDEPLERGSLSLLLENEGYHITTVDNGMNALNLLEQKQFDIVLSDIRMPKMTGMDLLREIKKRDISSEVILITAYGEIKDAVASYMSEVKSLAFPTDEQSYTMDESIIKQLESEV